MENPDYLGARETPSKPASLILIDFFFDQSVHLSEAQLSLREAANMHISKRQMECGFIISR